MGSLSVSEARDRILARVRCMPLERVAIADSLGRVLEEDVVAPRDHPPWDNSAMDGYAVRAADVVGASAQSAARLEVTEEIAAGYMPTRTVGPGEAAQIMTGAPMPEGADAVVRVEDTRREGEGPVEILLAVESGKDIRRAGEDMFAGATVLEPGKLIGPAEIGLMAAVGASQVSVRSRPVVAIVATGDELVEPGQPLAKGQIVNSNAYALAALVREAGGVPRYIGIARDNREDLRAKLEDALRSDVIVTSAGVSVGEHDYVKEVLEELGTEMGFWRVAMRPGHPLVFGTAGDRLVFGLPGNPVSSMVSFELFVAPCLRKMSGHARIFRRVVDVVLDEPVRTSAGRTHFLRGIVEERDGRLHARTTGPQGSGILRSMSLANALLVVSAEVSEVEAGEVVQAMYLGSAALYAESRPF